MARMFNPPHPGTVLKDGWLPEGETISGWQVNWVFLVSPCPAC